MLDIGWSELLVVAVILIVVVGPRDLPPMLRAFGKMTSRLRKTAGEFRSQFDEALREAELDEVKQTIQDAKRFNPAETLREAINPLRQMGEEIRADLRAATAVENPSPKVAGPDDPAQEMDSPLPFDIPQSEDTARVTTSQPVTAALPAVAATNPASAVSVPVTPVPASPASSLSSPPPELMAKPTGTPAPATPVEMADPKPKRGRKAPGPAMASIEASSDEPAEKVKPRRRSVAAAEKSPVVAVVAAEGAEAKPKRRKTTAKKDPA